MSRLFISHSRANDAAAIALGKWLKEEGFDDIFLDVDSPKGIAPGERWQEALRAAADRCEAVLVLVSPAWLASPWCLAEFLLAKSLHKKIFGLIIESVPFDRIPVEMTAEWQLCELVGPDRLRSIDIEIGQRREQVAFREVGLEQLRRGLERAGLEARSFPWPPPNDARRSPYRGLRALEPEDAAVFFGRDAMIVRGLGHIRGMVEGGDEAILAILGASGAGKSSFVRAGLWPRLLRDDSIFLPLPVIRPETAVITGPSGLAASLAEAFARYGDTRSPGRIKEALATGAKGWLGLIDEITELAEKRRVGQQGPHPAATVILVIDQAEELYNAEGAGEVADFLENLSYVLKSAPATERAKRALAIITIRSDRYERFQTDARLPGLKQSLFSLPSIQQAQFKDIIEGPARRILEAGGRLDIDPSLTEQLISDARGVDGLALLAFTLERLYLDYGSEGSLTLAHYKTIGGVQGSIEAGVAQALADPNRSPTIPEQKDQQYALLRAAFIPWLTRISADGLPVRRVTRFSDIPSASRGVIERLVQARLLVKDRKSGVDTVEAAHESLLRQWPVLAGWLTTDADDLRIIEGVEQAASEWTRNHRQDSWLDHRAERLSEAERVTSRSDFRNRLDDDGSAYLVACRAREYAESQRLARERVQLAQIKTAKSYTRWAFAAAAICGIALAGLWGIWQYGPWLLEQRYWWQNVRPYLRASAEAERVVLGPPFQDCRHCPEMIVVPKRQFTMGGPLNDSGERNEKPRHTVNIGRDYAVAKHETTFEEWNACASHGGCKGRIFSTDSKSARLPVIRVSWDDAESYAKWLKEITGKSYRLLSEAEWEHMARGGSDGEYSFDDDASALANYAWFETSGPHEVETRLPNKYGLFDTIGNVSEWVQDCYQDAYRTVPVDGGPALTGDCSRRVVRGGDWQSRASALRVSTRSGHARNSRTLYIGFRVAREVTR